MENELRRWPGSRHIYLVNSNQPRWLEPVLDTVWWGPLPGLEAAEDVDLAAFEVQADSEIWCVLTYKPGRGMVEIHAGRWKDLPGGNKPAHVGSVPAPLPKVRKGTEIRWHEGRWQKLLKAGWVTA